MLGSEASVRVTQLRSRGLALPVTMRVSSRALKRQKAIRKALGSAKALVAELVARVAVETAEHKARQQDLEGAYADVLAVMAGELPLNARFEGYRLLQLTDLHISRLVPEEWARQVVDRANAAEVDLIVVTGQIQIATATDGAIGQVQVVAVIQHEYPEGAPVFAAGSEGWKVHPDVEAAVGSSAQRVADDLQRHVIPVVRANAA